MAPAPPPGILLSNLGTPDEPTPPAVRRYLREFLGDRRVVDAPRAIWWFLLNFVILPRRARASAALYRSVWTPEGSPLLVIGRRQAAALERAARVPVELGMRYGSPSLESALAALEARGCRRILLFPLYPQYAGATSGSTSDALAARLRARLRARRAAPETRTVRHYHDDAAYVRCVAASVREAWEGRGEPERLLLSFHGLPKRYVALGDPYEEQCRATAEAVARELGLSRARWEISFQSRFGREEWLTPYTDETLRAWGAQRLASVDVVCPGFAADCLETLEEIAVADRGIFERAGGGRFGYVPALNDRPDHVAALSGVALRNLQGWVEPRGG